MKFLRNCLFRGLHLFPLHFTRDMFDTKSVFQDTYLTDIVYQISSL